MPYTALTITEAISQTNSRVAVGNAAGVLDFYISTFTALWSPNFNKDNEAERTVRNWVVQSEVISARTPPTGNAQQAQDVVDIAARVLYATNAALAAGRITAAQRDAVLGAWNGSFGATP